MKETYTINFAGRELTVEVGEMSEFANGSVFITYGQTQILVTACMSKDVKELDYFPLGVNYEEKMYSVGKIPGGFLRREGRASEKATLAARLIDRPLRPLFDKGVRNDIQIIATVMSVEYDTDPDIPALFGSSLALVISDIPFNGPCAAVNIGLVDGEFIVNPTSAQRGASQLDLTVAGTRDGVTMVEAGAIEVEEDKMIDAIMFAQEQIEPLLAFQEEIALKCGKEKKTLRLLVPSDEIQESVYNESVEKLKGCFVFPDKARREELIDIAKDEIMEKNLELFPGKGYDISEVFTAALKSVVRDMIINESVRPDGRGLEEIRPITCEASKLRRVHGSAMFTRGQTQVLSALTLGAVREEQIIDNLTEEESRRFLHHYNFPPFSVGETGPIRGPGRREIGHGALAERALEPVIPPTEEFPYTIRIVSEVLASNGSSSMASICASTLALMDAGVPIRAAVAGIAMGLVHEDRMTAVLSDIQGMEDFYGDMDFKVAGTSRGITSIQMDIKIKGLDRTILAKALNQAKEGRMHILKKMLEELPEPREDLKEFAPRIITIEIPVDKIREVIGAGGKVINKIIEETGVKIDIMDDGKVYIASPDLESSAKAKSIIESIIKEVEIGDVYTGKVTRLLNFGAFVELPNGKEGLVHLSKLSKNRNAKIADLVKVGDIMTVKVTEMKQGKIDLDKIR
ncbi:MAG: polyribonucleotide nucleotidyltransferase [Eubacteriaceae bacterium]|nr:polyribonucleotide nucleotidyltransferase [Eubacteriaceae bacterium]